MALLFTGPDRVRGNLLSYFAGVRTDGANATIIGAKLGDVKLDMGRMFGGNGAAEISCTAAGRNLRLRYENPLHLDWGGYTIGTVQCWDRRWEKGRFRPPHSQGRAAPDRWAAGVHGDPDPKRRRPPCLMRKTVM